MTDLVAAAESLARAAHAGQLDKQGRDYAEFHLRPVATLAGEIAAEHGADPDPDLAIATGWLHDILEDTDVTIGELQELGFGAIAGDIETLTHKGDNYQAYIEELVRSASINAVIVKLADNRWNSSGLDALNEPTRIRLAEKYALARPILLHRLGAAPRRSTPAG